MPRPLSADSSAILLLTASLGEGGGAEPLLTNEEYSELAMCLQDLGARPSELIGEGAGELVARCAGVVDEDRMARLLGRRDRLQGALERWEKLGVQVVTRADREYPRSLKQHLREDAPAAVWALGDLSILSVPGFSLVSGASGIPADSERAFRAGEMAAYAGFPVISGGDAGPESDALRAALRAGSPVCQVPRDDLARFASRPQWMRQVQAGRLVLVSDTAPGASRTAEGEIARKRLTLALGACGLLVAASSEKDPCWLASAEMLGKYESMPLYYCGDELRDGLYEYLADMDMRQWVEPEGVVDFSRLAGMPAMSEEQEDASEPRFSEVPPGAEEAEEPPRGGQEEIPAADPLAQEKLGELRGAVAALVAGGLSPKDILGAVIAELSEEGKIDSIAATILSKVGFPRFCQACRRRRAPSGGCGRLRP